MIGRLSKREQEYSRRNVLHAKAVGALANSKAVLARLAAAKTPRWLLEAMGGIVARLEDVAPEMAVHRDEMREKP